jgi:hypothetical protein
LDIKPGWIRDELYVDGWDSAVDGRHTSMSIDALREGLARQAKAHRL